MPCNNHLDLFDLAAMTPHKLALTLLAARLRSKRSTSGPLTALMRACGGSHSGYRPIYYIYIGSRPIDLDRPIKSRSIGPSEKILSKNVTKIA